MYKKVMVPLDGSDLAECVLPHLDSLAKGCLIGSVTLVRVLESRRDIKGEAYFTDKEMEQIEALNKSEAQTYLDKVAGGLKYDTVTVQKQVLTGRAAETLADYATRNDIDLILVATHGRSGVSRWVWGSVTDRILRSACVPVFMIRAPGCVLGISG